VPRSSNSADLYWSSASRWQELRNFFAALDLDGSSEAVVDLTTTSRAKLCTSFPHRHNTKTLYPRLFRAIAYLVNFFSSDGMLSSLPAVMTSVDKY
jgi:hypothetical protein